MHTQARPLLSLALPVALALTLAACGDDSGRASSDTVAASVSDSAASASATDGSSTSGDASTTDDATTSTSSTGGATASESESAGSTTDEPPPPFEVTPPEATVLVENGVSEVADFDALYGGESIKASWSLGTPGVATIDPNGLAGGIGAKGGETEVIAQYMGKAAKGLLKVVLTEVSEPLGPLDPADKELLLGAIDPDAEIAWLYPYDRMVYPLDLRAPEMMWDGGAAGDKYLIRLQNEYLDVQVFQTADPPSRFLIDPALWSKVTATASGGDVNLKVSRLKAGEQVAKVVVDHTWTIASGALDGSVYYWANSLGRVLRINPGADAPEDFLAAAGQNGCSTCHSVSADGNTLIIGGDIAVSTFDLSNNVPVLDIQSVGKPVRNWAMPAISPDGTVLIENAAPLPGPPGGSDGMWDAVTGVKLLDTGLEGIQLNMPAFAPNGELIAAIDHNTLGLVYYVYDHQLKKATGPIPLVDAGADPNLNGITFPSVSPDGKWIVYHRGSYPNSLDTRYSRGDLYLASVDQAGLEYRLKNVNGDDYPFAAGDRDHSYNYEPTFAPIASGGYTWVVFTSRRTYGNRLTAGKDAVKQLWVFAIDQSPKPGEEPSHAAFWLPGQDMGTLNMRAFWALKAEIPG
ncbi:MAG: WD40 repeat domain-containing protein [Myxococcales bacterium]|nr:WD40 repeat domain-containing protein [Myxococcales bacterium]